jgi:hypothetical protein
MTARRPIALLLAVLLVSPLVPPRAARAADPDEERERAWLEALRREDPGSADRYVALRDARQEAIAEFERVEKLYAASAPEARALFVPQLRQARRKYAQTSLALLEFFDERDRRAQTNLEGELDRLKAVIEEHARTRAELEKILSGD